MASIGPISVVMPVHNGADYIGAALDSVLIQTVPPAEVVVVDDGSTDATPDILSRYGARIRTVRQRQTGCAGARNAGVALCRAELITFMDCDDLMHPRRLELSLAALDRHATADLCIHYVENFWIAGLDGERRSLGDHPLAQPQLGYLLPSMTIRRQAMARVGPFDPAYAVGEDTDWFIRAEELGLRVVAMKDILLYRRIHRNNITRRQATVARDCLTRMVFAARRRRALAGRPRRFDLLTEADGRTLSAPSPAPSHAAL